MNEIKIRYRRYSYLIPIPFLLAMIALACWVGFVMEDRDNNLTIIAIVFIAVATFLLINFLRLYFSNPVVMLVNDAGFEYNPNNATTGFIPWTDVEKAEVITVSVARAAGSRNSEAALGVWLKDPEAYFEKWNIVIRSLMRVNQKMYGATILIQPSSLGKDYAAVRQFFQKKTGQSD